MKFWLLAPCFLILATSCSHSDTKTDSAAPAPTAKAASAPTAKTAEAPKKSHKGKAEAAASKGQIPMGEHTSCKSAGEERVIEIVTKGTGCAVEYTKQAQKSEIATAEHETEHCQAVAQKVRQHLEGAGFSCN